jgi:CheY-like chemotaxis protein
MKTVSNRRQFNYMITNRECGISRITRKELFHQRRWTMYRLRILLVEDLQDCADSMALLLKLWGCKPTVVYEGKQAIEVAATLHPDVVFLDIGLPDVDGYEVARQIRRMPELARTRLVAVTGYGREEDIRRCQEAGIDVHFLKPVDAEEIKKVLTSLVYEACALTAKD